MNALKGHVKDTYVDKLSFTPLEIWWFFGAADFMPLNIKVFYADAIFSNVPSLTDYL